MHTQHTLHRIPEVTADGSHTLYVPELDEHYHSVHGAVREAMHVFIDNGLLRCDGKETAILEVGFGTGLNAFLTLLNRGNRMIRYFGLEKHPLAEGEYGKLNYPVRYPPDKRALFLKMHRAIWNVPVEITPGFYLTKLKDDLLTFDFSRLPLVDLVFFDAFAPGKQSEMWQDAILEKVAAATAPGGIFVTYCAQGKVRRSLERNGFAMLRLPGPPGKREMLYGKKSENGSFKKFPIFAPLSGKSANHY